MHSRPSLFLSLLLMVAWAPAQASAQRPAWPPADQPLEQGIGELPVLKPPTRVRTPLDRALAARDYERAEELLADAIAHQPDARQLLTQIANVFMLDRKPLNAAIALKKAEVLRELDDRERLQLALAYIAMQRDDWARPELDRLASSGADAILPAYWLARLDYNAGQYASAIERLQGIVDREPTFARAHDNLGLCYEALNQADKAIPHYREAVRLNQLSDEPSGWPPLNLAILLRARGDVAEAESLVREALRHDAALAPAHYQLGVLLEEAGRIDDAVQALEKATATDRGYAEPYYALSRIHRRRGKTAEADAALATFQQLHDAQRTTETPPR